MGPVPLTRKRWLQVGTALRLLCTLQCTAAAAAAAAAALSLGSPALRVRRPSLPAVGINVWLSPCPAVRKALAAGLFINAAKLTDELQVKLSGELQLGPLLACPATVQP